MQKTPGKSQNQDQSHIMDDYGPPSGRERELDQWQLGRAASQPLIFFTNPSGDGGVSEGSGGESGLGQPPTAPKLGEALRQAIFEQDDAINAVVSANHRIATGLTSPDKPLTSLLFIGPTGCGKTEMARLWARHLGWPLVRYDMSEFSERHNVSSLLGSPTGYIGSDQKSRISEINQHPQCIVLLDEIEKAHRDVQLVFLQALDNGLITDRSGNKVDFRSAVIIMTTNALSGQPSRLGFGAKEEEGGAGRPHAISTRDLPREFPPEFLGRIKSVVPFTPLSISALHLVLGKSLREVNALRGMAGRSLRLSLSPAAAARVIDLALQDGLGARPVTSRLDTEVVGPLAQEIAEGRLAGVLGRDISFDYQDGRYQLSVSDEVKAGDAASPGAQGTEGVGGMGGTAQQAKAAGKLPVETGHSLLSIAKACGLPFVVEKTSYTEENIHMMKLGQTGFYPLGTIFTVTDMDHETGDFHVIAVLPDRRISRKYLRSYSQKSVFTLKQLPSEP